MRRQAELLGLRLRLELPAFLSAAPPSFTAGLKTTRFSNIVLRGNLTKSKHNLEIHEAVHTQSYFKMIKFTITNETKLKTFHEFFGEMCL